MFSRFPMLSHSVLLLDFMTVVVVLTISTCACVLIGDKIAATIFIGDYVNTSKDSILHKTHFEYINNHLTITIQFLFSVVNRTNFFITFVRQKKNYLMNISYWCRFVYK
jgi:hypothetical protein